MGVAKIIFKNGQSMLCTREGGEDREAADSLLIEVGEKKAKKAPKDTLVRCDNGGGFDATEVVGVTLPDEQPEQSLSEELKEEQLETFGF